jgi:putative polymerase
MAIYGSRDFDRFMHRWQPPAGARAVDRPMRLPAKLAVAILFAATAFNLGLCFVNTRMFPTSAQTAMLAEALIIGSAASLLLYRRDQLAAFYMAVVCSYFSLLFIVREAIDLKPIRDLLIPIIFLHMGQRFLTRKQTDSLVRWLVAITLAVSVFEFTLPDLYTRFFDVLTYFINKGATRAEAADFIVNGFNINGDRPTGQGRELLPFLGLHRSGSIFLEPVTAGNFGAICGAWFMQYGRSALRRWGWIALCAAIIVLADGRFGLLLLLVAIGLH